MVITKIFIRGYSSDFEIDIKRKLSMDEAEAYVKKQIVDTGFVKKLRYYTDEGETELVNDKYNSPSEIKLENNSKNYLKHENSNQNGNGQENEKKEENS